VSLNPETFASGSPRGSWHPRERGPRRTAILRLDANIPHTSASYTWPCRFPAKIPNGVPLRQRRRVSCERRRTVSHEIQHVEPVHWPVSTCPFPAVHQRG